MSAVEAKHTNCSERSTIVMDQFHIENINAYKEYKILVAKSNLSSKPRIFVFRVCVCLDVRKKFNSKSLGILKIFQKEKIVALF